MHVAALDDRFEPATVAVGRGGTVIFDFEGSTDHTATDGSGLELYDSGTVSPGGPSTRFTFEGAGLYRFVCSTHAGMAGRVQVPVRVTPSSGGIHRTFTVTWASVVPAGDHVYDVQIRRPGRNWTSWRTGVAARADDFMPDGRKGRYRFRARMRDTGLGRASGWSVAATIRVG